MVIPERRGQSFDLDRKGQLERNAHGLLRDRVREGKKPAVSLTGKGKVPRDRAHQNGGTCAVVRYLLGLAHLPKLPFGG